MAQYKYVWYVCVCQRVKSGGRKGRSDWRLLPGCWFVVPALVDPFLDVARKGERSHVLPPVRGQTGRRPAGVPRLHARLVQGAAIFGVPCRLGASPGPVTGTQVWYSGLVHRPRVGITPFVECVLGSAFQVSPLFFVPVPIVSNNVNKPTR